jgi:hypothetical protein
VTPITHPGQQNASEALHVHQMIRIAITAEAFDAVAVMLPGSVGFERGL